MDAKKKEKEPEKEETPIYVTTTRFTDETWNENIAYRTRSKHAVKAIYSSPYALDPRHSPPRANVFVIEMNNSQNQIEGIGLVKNYAISQKYRIYNKHENYNRYTFLGKARVDRADMKNRKLLEKLEEFCFKGKGHQKRLRGITRIPKEKWQQWCLEHWKKHTTTPPAAAAAADTETTIIWIPNLIQMIRREFARTPLIAPHK
jgi:hypothetical protein